MNTIHVIGVAPHSEPYDFGTFEEFAAWEIEQKELQLDIETNVTDYWCEYKIKTIQFGQVTNSPDKTQWLLQWSVLTDLQKEHIKAICENPNKCKLAHTVTFEAVVLRFHGITLANVYDTMLAEKVIHGGIEEAGYALADLYFRHFHQLLDKTEQTNFGDDILTESKVLYAAADVQRLDELREKQMPIINTEKLNRVLADENKVVLGFADITYYGMTLDKNKWLDCEKIAYPVVEAALTRLNNWLKEEPFRANAIELKVLSEEDRLQINFNAPLQKRELLTLLFPLIPGATKPVITKYIRDNDLSLEDLNILMELKEGNSTPFANKLVRDHYDYLVSHDYLLPALTPDINWNSRDQALPVLKVVHPRLTSLSEESLSNTSHPVFTDYKEYVDALKLVNTYGETFIEKHVEPDGKVRTRFNQILVTGRVSSSDPNMQQIPVKEKEYVGHIVQEWLTNHPGKKEEDFNTRYRNAFVCEEDEVFVDSDFTGQELAIIAHIAKDPIWFEAIKSGKDLHSICAEMMYGRKWLDASEADCIYYKPVNGVAGHFKCSCTGHKPLRYNIKTVNFMLAYGGGEMKLASELKISVPEAKNLIELYFRTFPQIASILKYLGNYGVTKGYIQTLYPYNRKRWFPFWKFAKGRIQQHLNGQYDTVLGTIERASKNMPIQGSGADMMKLAMIMVREWIYVHNMQDRIRIVAQVHDQLTTICKKSIAEEWKVTFNRLMEEAALVIIPSGILKADTQITPVWTK